MLLADAQLIVRQDPPVLFYKASFQLVGPQYWLLELFLPTCRTLTFPLLNFMRFLYCPFLQPVKVPLDGSTTLWCINRSSKFGLICKLAEGTICLVIQIINEEFEHDCSTIDPCGTLLVTGLQTRLCATENHPLGLAVEPFFNPVGDTRSQQ